MSSTGLAGAFFSSAILMFFLALRSDHYVIFREAFRPIERAKILWRTERRFQHLVYTLIFFLFSYSLVGIVSAVIFTLVFYLIMRFFWEKVSFIMKRAKLRKLMLQNMDNLINSLVSALQAGYGFLAALRATEAFTPEPLRSEIRKIAERTEGGKMSLEDSLFVFHETYKLPETRRFVYTMSFASKYSGRDLIPILKAMARTFRMIYQTQEKLSAKTTQIRMSLVILPLLPVVMLLMLQAMLPDAVHMLFTSGRIILFIGIGLDIIAVMYALNLLAKFANQE